MKKVLIAVLMMSACTKMGISWPVPSTPVVTTPAKSTMFTALQQSSLPSSIVCVGSDLTHGTDSVASYPSQLQGLLNQNGVSNATVFNRGENYIQWDYMLQEVSVDVTPNYISPGKNIAIAWEVSSDVFQNRVPVEIYYDHFKTYCDSLRANNWSVIAVTTPFRDTRFSGLGDGTYTPSGYMADEYSQVIDQINDSIRMNWQTFANGLADVAASFTQYDSTLYLPDHFNLTAKGNGNVAQIVLTSLQSN